MSQGSEIINMLKQLVLSKMRSNPSCEPESAGLGNVEIEQVCELELHLQSQDHYLCYSILHSLIADGLVEKRRWPSSPRRPKYRLTTQGILDGSAA